MTALELLFEPEGLPAFELPAGLAAGYPGSLGFDAPRLFADPESELHAHFWPLW